MTRWGYTYVRLPEFGEISIDPIVQCGEPCIRDTRIPASVIAKHYDGSNMKYICGAWGITEQQVMACVEYANSPKPE